MSTNIGKGVIRKLVDIPTPTALVFAGFILGSGYMAIIYLTPRKYFFSKDGLKNFDKLMLSLVLGMFSFFSLLYILNLNFDLNNAEQFGQFLKILPLLFILNIGISIIVFGVIKLIFFGD